VTMAVVSTSSRHSSAVAADVALATLGTTQQNASRYADSELRKKVIDIHLDVSRNLAHERRRDVSTLVIWDRRAASVGMTELLVRSALTNLAEPELR
jgi:hypothetical protein